MGGSIAQSLINAYFREGTTIREYKTAEQVDLDLANGRIDMQVTARSYLNTIQKTQAYSNVVMTGPLFKGGLLGSGSLSVCARTKLNSSANSILQSWRRRPMALSKGYPKNGSGST